VSSTKRFVPGASAKRCVRSDPQAAQGGKRRERSDPGNGVEGQVSSAKQFATGARSTESERGEIQRSHRAESVEHRAIRTEQSGRINRAASTNPSERIDSVSTPGGKRRERSDPGNGVEGQVSSAEQSANGAKRGSVAARRTPRATQALDVNHGAIRV